MRNRNATRPSLPQVLVAAVWFAATTQSGAVTCENVKIEAASLSTSLQTLKATANCSHTMTETETGVSAKVTSPTKIFSASSKATNVLDLTAYADLSWNSETHVAKELVDFTGNSTGTRIVEATCSMNPFLDTPPLRSLSCGPVDVQVVVKSGDTPAVLTDKYFWFRDLLSTATVKTISKVGSDEPPPPPPPPKVEPPART